MTEGRKDDNGKLRFDLLPVEPLRKLVDVYTRGARKYADNNWRQGLAYGRVFGAMMRHAWAWWGGEQDDPENGQHHLAAVAWGALTLIELEQTHPELDDRWIEKRERIVTEAPAIFISGQSLHDLLIDLSPEWEHAVFPWGDMNDLARQTYERAVDLIVDHGGGDALARAVASRG